jgi:LacI family transcriptional regulator
MLLLSADEPAFAVRARLRNGSLDGLIISAISLGQPWVEELLDLPVPTVLVGAHPDRSDVPVVDTENRLASRAAVGHLFDQGCRRVAVLAGPQDRIDAQQRLAGFYDAHRERGVPLDQGLVLYGHYQYESGQRLGEQLLELRPDGVFASNDLLAYGAMAAVSRRGILIPDQMAFIGFDGASGYRSEAIALSTVRQPIARIAQSAVDVVSRLADNRPVPPVQLLDPELVVAESSMRRLALAVDEDWSSTRFASLGPRSPA